MHEYWFEYEDGKKSKMVIADTLTIAESLMGSSGILKYELVRAWDSTGRKTYDIFYTGKDTLPEDYYLRALGL